MVARLLCLLPIFAALLPSILPAQDSAKGALRGFVQDADFFVPLSGARVVVEGGSQSAVTDGSGAFFINDIAAGEYALLITKDGYISERRAGLVVNVGVVKEVELQMTGQVVELDEFIVSADEITETSVTQALQLRTELKSFTDVLGAQFIAQTGASDAAKLLAKTTGVNVADGKFVIVRGLADRYNSVTLNGLRVPSSDPDRRAVALDLFPTSAIRDVRTSKTFTPDMPAEATGAGINIVTKSVPDEDFVKVKIGTGFNTGSTSDEGMNTNTFDNNNDLQPITVPEDAGFLSYRGGGTGLFGNARDRAIPDTLRAAALPQILTVGDPLDTPEERDAREAVNQSLSREMGTKAVDETPVDFSFEASIGRRIEFMGAPAGLTIALDYSKKFTGSPSDFAGRYDWNPQGETSPQETRRLANIRFGQETMRAGMLVSLGIQPDADNQITATYFFNRVAEDRATLQFGPDGQNPDTLDYRESILYTERQLQVFQIQSSHLLDSASDLRVDWALAYNQSYQLEPDSRFIAAKRFDLNPGSFYAVLGAPLVPPFQRIWRELYDQNYTARVDIQSSLTDFEQDEGGIKIKYGGLLDYSNRNYRADSFAYSRGASDNAFFFTGNRDTWGDQFLNQAIPVNDPGNFSILNATHLFRVNEAEIYTASQMIAAGYLRFDVEIGSALEFTFGVRLESTDLRVQASPIHIYQGLDQPLRLEFLSDEQRSNLAIQQLLENAYNGDPAAQNDPILQARSRASIIANDLLPAIAATWNLGNEMRLRASYARTIARPSFKEIAPVPFQNVETGDLFLGNVDLRMSSIDNFDSRWEWFPDPGGLVALSFFSKFIRNPIELSQNGVFLKYTNVSLAVVYGFELEFQRSLSFITEELRNFTLGANYSYIYSQATRPAFPGGVNSVFGQSRRLQGQPDYILNFNLNYENPDSGFGTGMLLNVVGAQLFAVGGTPNAPDVLQQPFSTLDLSISQRVGKNGRLSFRAQNVLNETFIRYFNNSQQPLHSTRRPGIGYSLSLTFDW